MGGLIWIESEGLDKGSTAAFIVKLGICDKPNDSPVHPVAPRGHAHNCSGDLPGHKLVFRDIDDVASSSSRYQRSL